MDSFLDTISEKIGLIHGAKRLFTLDGRQIRHIEELENNQVFFESIPNSPTFQPRKFRAMWPPPQALLSICPTVNGMRKNRVANFAPLPPQALFIGNREAWSQEGIWLEAPQSPTTERRRALESRMQAAQIAPLRWFRRKRSQI